MCCLKIYLFIYLAEGQDSFYAVASQGGTSGDSTVKTVIPWYSGPCSPFQALGDYHMISELNLCST